MKSVLWSIKKEHLDNIKNGYKLDEIRKKIPLDLHIDTVNYLYETKSSGGLGKIIGECNFKNKTYIYADIIDGTKHLYNTAFIKPCISNERLFDYLYDSTKKDGWALRISDLVIYDKPRELSDFATLCKGTGSARNKTCKNCRYFCFDDDPINGYTRFCGANKRKTLPRPPQSWCYVEELR